MHRITEGVRHHKGLKLLNIIPLLAGNLLIIIFFGQALIYPELNTTWIYNTAILIFAIEFLSIHSSVMSLGVSTSERKKDIFFLLSFYLFFTIGLSVIFKNWVLPLYFFISTFIKFNEAKYSPSNKVFFIRSFAIFLFLMFFIVFTASFWKAVFPFPAEVLAARPPDWEGLFLDVPQATLVWGVLYFTIHFIINVSILFRKREEL